MVRKRAFVILLGCMIALLGVSSQTPNIALAEPNSWGQTAPVIVMEIADSPWEEDADWPITYNETQTSIDSATGRIRTRQIIVRKSPPGYVPDSSAADCIAQVGETPTTLCSYERMVTLQVLDESGDYAAYAKHVAILYCSADYGCVHYQPVALNLWWTKRVSRTPNIQYTPTGVAPCASSVMRQDGIPCGVKPATLANGDLTTKAKSSSTEP